LIIDDDDITRTVLDKYLTLQGYSVSCAATGTEGIREALEQSPDVVLLDYRLGDTDGVRVLRDIRSHSPWDHPGVALFTADLNVSERSAEVSQLNALVVSKLCDIDRIGELVAYLSAGVKIDASNDSG
jgi:DNA-binding response OmpR family regulator